VRMYVCVCVCVCVCIGSTWLETVKTTSGKTKADVEIKDNRVYSNTLL